VFGDLTRMRHGDDQSPPIETRPADDFGPGYEPRPGVLEVAEALHALRGNRSAQSWQPKVRRIPAGHSVLLAGPSPMRARLLVYPDPANTAPTFLSDVQDGNIVTGAPAFLLPAGGVPLELHNTGEVWATSTADATVYVLAEFNSPAAVDLGHRK
jgi:hypothetical protein